MSRTKAKARRNGSRIGGRKKTAADRAAQWAANMPILERKWVLGSISRPLYWPSQHQRKFFNAFITRLQKRDKELEESYIDTAPEDALNHKFENMRLAGQVESILDVCTIDERTHYLVLWKGQLIKECTWETEENLSNSMEAIEKFYAAFPTKKMGGPAEIKVKRET